MKVTFLTVAGVAWALGVDPVVVPVGVAAFSSSPQAAKRSEAAARRAATRKSRVMFRGV
jgi:hypothetical protein